MGWWGAAVFLHSPFPSLLPTLHCPKCRGSAAGTFRPFPTPLLRLLKPQ